MSLNPFTLLGQSASASSSIQVTVDVYGHLVQSEHARRWTSSTRYQNATRAQPKATMRPQQMTIVTESKLEPTVRLELTTC